MVMQDVSKKQILGKIGKFQKENLSKISYNDKQLSKNSQAYFISCFRAKLRLNFSGCCDV